MILAYCPNINNADRRLVDILDLSISANLGGPDHPPLPLHWRTSPETSLGLNVVSAIRAARPNKFVLQTQATSNNWFRVPEPTMEAPHIR